MKVAFILLFCGGLLGLFDTIWYHIIVAKLYKTQAAFWEQLTHVIRILFYACFYILIGVKASGVWWWIYPALIIVELVNTGIDTILEPSTRVTLGGIPPKEYTLHCMILLTQGGALASIIGASLPYRAEADGIAWAPLDLGFFSWMPMATAALAVVLSFFEGGGFVRMAIQRIRSPQAALT
jgi:hypothetical protein